ncbi:unnamed protein product [Bursaphelenchus xylophilus]|uniref:(pine wood nematode) hypothetical protein n=1 Tax=Bursaphelenchus xylophilus TaxID=6326 RepID=A0A1I7S4G9_BURXY|nr:unnamed protein product [Bursaphelenchus xylophilus]CAG9117077.1 unnamed protein product [Bursaphelenchus xylophilus]
MNVTEDNCYESYIMETQPEMRLGYFLQLILASGVSVRIVMAVRSRHKRHVPAHPNFKLLIASACFAVWLYSTFEAIDSAILLFNSLRATPENCATNIYRTTCLLIKIPFFYAVPMLSTIHVLMFMERSTAFLMKGNYEKKMSKYGVIITAVAWFCCLPFEILIIGKFTLAEKVVHCQIFNNDTEVLFGIALELTTLVDIATTMGDTILRFRARRSSRKTKEFANFDTYTLSDAYQQKENLRLMTMMVPISTVFAAGHLIFVPSLLSLHSLIPIYAKFRIGEKFTPEDVERLRVAVFEINMGILLTILLIVISLYCRMGEKLMNEKQAALDRPDTDMCFSMFEKQMNAKLMSKKFGVQVKKPAKKKS